MGDEGSADGAALAQAFAASGAKLAVLCSSDALYGERGLEAAGALAAAKAHLYVAGRPGEMEAQWRAAGARDFIFAGADALALLREALQAA